MIDGGSHENGSFKSTPKKDWKTMDIPAGFVERADYPQFSHEPTESDDRRSKRDFQVRALIKKANNILRSLGNEKSTNPRIKETSIKPKNAIERADYINGEPTEEDDRRGKRY